MNNTASVLSTDGKTAKVRVHRKSACEGCANCEGEAKCHAEILLTETPRTFETTVINDIGAKVGDRVELATDGKLLLPLAFLAFIMPIVLTVLAYLVISAFSLPEYAILVGTVAVFFISFLACAALANRISAKRVKISISKILEESGK